MFVRKPLRANGSKIRARFEPGTDEKCVRIAILAGRYASEDRSGIQRYRVLVRIVTNSSAAVGWIPIVVSNCVLVAPQLTATASP